MALLAILLLLAGLLHPVLAKTSLDMVFSKVNCTTMTADYIQHFNCTISKTKRQSVSLEMRFKKDIPSFKLNVRLTIPQTGGERVLFNLSNINGCDLLAAKNQILLMQIARKQLDRYGNLPHKCPFAKDQLFYIRNYRFDMSQMPAVVFQTQFDFWVEFLHEQHVLMSGYARMQTRRRSGETKAHNK